MDPENKEKGAKGGTDPVNGDLEEINEALAKIGKIDHTKLAKITSTKQPKFDHNNDQTKNEKLKNDDHKP